MTEYKVTWEIDIEADTHEEAAREALRIQRDPDSVATCFDVRNSKHWKDRKTIELDPVELDPEDVCPKCGETGQLGGECSYCGHDCTGE